MVVPDSGGQDFQIREEAVSIQFSFVLPDDKEGLHEAEES
jgi:hypothetical protein